MFGEEEALSNVGFLEVGVARKMDSFHAVEEWGGDVGEGVCGADEDGGGEGNGQAEVVVNEGTVLFRVEDFKEGGTGIAIVGTGADFVDFICRAKFC